MRNGMSTMLNDWKDERAKIENSRRSTLQVVSNISLFSPLFNTNVELVSGRSHLVFNIDTRSLASTILNEILIRENIINRSFNAHVAFGDGDCISETSQNVTKCDKSSKRSILSWQTYSRICHRCSDRKMQCTRGKCVAHTWRVAGNWSQHTHTWHAHAPNAPAKWIMSLGCALTRAQSEKAESKINLGAMR